MLSCLHTLEEATNVGPAIARASADIELTLAGAQSRAVGDLIGRYCLRARLGSGGSGEVWRALDSRLGREVALKFLCPRRSAAADAEEWLARLRAEARLLAQLHHPGIVTLYELEERDGVPFLAMELVAGATLRDRLASGPLSVAAAVDLACEVGEALAAAHTAGVAHGDLHPGNVLLGEQGGLKLVDFGLARLLEGTAGPSDEVAGTVGYLAPERLAGAAVAPSGDLFSLGVVLHQMLSGRRPFARPTIAAELRAMALEDPSSLGRLDGEVPLALASLVRRLLARQPEARPRSAADAVAELRSVAARLRPATAAPATPAASGATAFRGLLPFSEADRDAFFGREEDATALLRKMTEPNFRLGVLYGGSGCGKTSLLRAGLVPKLREAGFLPLVCRSLDPLAAILAEGRRQTALEARAGEAVDGYLRRLGDEMAAPVALIFDQFEEFFVRFRSAAERDPFFSFVAACERAAQPAARFLFAIRSDFLYLVAAAFDGRIEEPLSAARRTHLAAFEPAQAREILARSASAAGMPLALELAARIADDLATDGRVLPSELQIIGEQVQRRGIATIADYRTAGGHEQLVHRHLEEVVEATRDADGARRLLLALISEEGIRRPATLDELVAAVPRGRAAVVDLLGAFVAARLVRELQDEEPWRYELQHEYLIGPIERSGGEVLGRRERANRLLGQHASAYALDRRARVPLADLFRIRRDADPRRRLEQRELMRRSWRRSLMRVGGATIGLAALATAAAAALSVREQWDGARLADGHTAAVRAAGFTPDGDRLASGGEDGRVILWDFRRRQALATFTDYGNWVTTMAISPDGRWLAYGGNGDRLVVRDLATRQAVLSVPGSHGALAALAFSPDGALLAASDDQETRIWEVGRWTLRLRVPDSASSAHGTLLFSADSRQLMNDALRSWDIPAGRQVKSRLDEDWGGNWIARSPDGRVLAAIAPLGWVHFVDLASESLIKSEQAHRDHGRAVAYSPDGGLIATGAEDVVLWDARTLQRVARLEYPSIVWHVAFSPDGKTLVSTHGDGAVVLWDVEGRERLGSLNEHAGSVRAVAYSPDGARLATAGDDRTVILWDTRSRRKQAVLLGHDTRVNGLAFAPDGRSLAVCDQNGNVVTWDAVTLSRQAAFASSHVCYGVAFSHDGQWLASTAGLLRRDGTEAVHLAQVSPGHGANYSLAFAPDDRWLAMATDSGEVARLDAPGFAISESLRTENKLALVTLAVSPDGRRLVTGGDDGVVRLFQASPLRELGELGRQTARIKSVAFSPDGRSVAVAADDRTVTLWDVRRRQRLATIGVHGAPVLAAAFSPDGNTLAIGGHDSSVRLYRRSRWLWGRRLGDASAP